MFASEFENNLDVFTLLLSITVKTFRFARTILPSIKAYYKSEKGQKEFAEWKRKKDLEKKIKED